MRFSTSAVVAAVAIGAQALPQTSLAPIVQISDGQIQVSTQVDSLVLDPMLTYTRLLPPAPLLPAPRLPAALPARTRPLRLPLPLRCSRP